jgi:hypothetical protein
MEAGIPLAKLMLKPFNEPNMPAWAQWEGFGDKLEDMQRYNEALLTFMDRARSQLPGITIGGPHLTVGNRDVRFPNDPVGFYYYHGEDGRFESSPCYEALRRLDVHFVHCYGMHPGQYADRAHGLRFLEYERYLQGKDVYVVEGAYGTGSGQAADQNTVRGQETVAYLSLLGEKYPQVKGVALWIGGDPHSGWFEFCHANGSHAESHRPVVYAVEAAAKGAAPAPPPEPPPEPEPGTVEGAGPAMQGLSEAMVAAVSVRPAPDLSVPRWKAVSVSVQPESDNMSLYAVLPAGASCMVRFGWADGDVVMAPKADPLAPDGARQWAASMPMFAPWGSYWVEVEGNSERVSGLGLYGADLDPRYKGHHPVLVEFALVAAEEEPAPQEEPEEEAPPAPPPEEEPGPGPMPEPGESFDTAPAEPTQDVEPYSLMAAFPRAGIEDVVDLRDEIESFSDRVALGRLWRPFKLIRLVVVHHSGSVAATQTPLTIARYRVVEKGDPTIPYHFCIGFDGRLFFTARLCWKLPNSGKSATNAESVAVCVLGDYRTQAVRKVQLETLRRLIWQVLPEFLGGGWGQYRGLYVIPHGRLVATECPGENLVDALVWEGDWSFDTSFDTAATQPTQDEASGGGEETPF